MIDPRFYAAAGPLKLAALFPDCELRGGDRDVTGVAPIDRAGPDDLCFFEGKLKGALETRAGAIVLKRALADAAPATASLVLSTHPRAQFAIAARRLVAERTLGRGSPANAPDAQLEPGVGIGPNAVIGQGVAIGQGAEIGANAVIGPGVRIGRRSKIGANAVVGFSLIGDDVNILPGAMIGQAGFGIAGGPTGPVDVPHFGRVIIEDRVTLGALCAVDRGLFDDTILSEDCKIDNLTHIAHNVVIGRQTMIAAFGGIAGSTTIGDGAVLGGRVGVADHLTVGAGARIGAGSAVLTSVPAGETWSGHPARPLRQWLRQTAWLARAAGRRDAGE